MKKVFQIIGYVILVLLAIVLVTIGPILKRPLDKNKFYTVMKEQLEKTTFQTTNGKLYATWGKVNITPHHEQSMAGYHIRPNFNSVHDSLFCRMAVLKNDKQVIFIINADLLFFPPTWKKKIPELWKKTFPEDDFYFSATHTHNGVGGFDASLTATALFGYYRKAWMDSCLTQIIHKMEFLRKECLPSTIAYYETSETNMVLNRFHHDSICDSKIRGFVLENNRSEKFIFFSFSAHPTSISKKSRTLSADYPAAVIKKLNNAGYEAMYMAGMVGSDRGSLFLDDYDIIDSMGTALSKKILETPTNKPKDFVTFLTSHIPIQFGESQLRVHKNWRIRDIPFEIFLTPLQGEFTFLQINDFILLGTPCDFASDLFIAKKIESEANNIGKNLVITSFNGNYIGYITRDEYYDAAKQEEVLALNWVGPYFGQYFSESIKEIIRNSAKASTLLSNENKPISVKDSLNNFNFEGQYPLAIK